MDNDQLDETEEGFPAEESLAPALFAWVESDNQTIRLQERESGAMFVVALPLSTHVQGERWQRLLAEDVARQLLRFADWLFDVSGAGDVDGDDSAYQRLFGGPVGPVAPDHETAILEVTELDDVEDEDVNGQAEVRQEKELSRMGITDLHEWNERHNRS